MELQTVFEWLDRLEGEATLVGGQALAVWEYSLGLSSTTETIDIDFLGDAAEALVLAERLGVQCRVAGMNDATPNTAVLFDADGNVLVDFLGQVAGLNETDILRRRLVLRTPRGQEFRILHPFDCLASRLSNLYLLPSKRNAGGFAQLRAAVDVFRAYCLQLLEQGSEREAIKLVNRAFDLALTDAGKLAYFQYGIDLMDGIPEVARFHSIDFVTENLPRRISQLREKRDRFAHFLQRFAPEKLACHAPEHTLRESGPGP